MSLNRHNYEEFFLLYVDNELSDAERKAVELFVEENADLKEELNMLQQTVMDADTFIFDKTSLLKEELTVLQENLLLYVDDELNEVDKLNIEKLLQTDNVANKELALLQQTKLQPDTSVVFADKKILYRKEKAKVFGMPWRRMAAAAIVIGFGIWTTITLNTTNKAIEGTVVTADKIKPATSKPNKTENTVTPVLSKTQKTTKDINTVTASTENITKQAAQKNVLPVNNKVQQNLQQQKNEEVITAQKEIKKPSNNLPEPDYNNFNKTGSNENIIASVTPLNTITENVNSGKITTATVSNNEVVNGYALNTKFTDGDADKDDDYADDDNTKKTKLGGLFRKVKRLVERNTNVKTGNGIKVAGFDIAIK